ncbi:hypothetical protein LV178_10020, partial [Burkholderia mallei]|nr:hypothetical protein [Burkholderia mallei]
GRVVDVLIGRDAQPQAVVLDVGGLVARRRRITSSLRHTPSHGPSTPRRFHAAHGTACIAGRTLVQTADDFAPHPADLPRAASCHKRGPRRVL